MLFKEVFQFHNSCLGYQQIALDKDNLFYDTFRNLGLHLHLSITTTLDSPSPQALVLYPSELQPRPGIKTKRRKNNNIYLS